MSQEDAISRQARHPYLHLGHPDDHIPKFELPETASKKPPFSVMVVAFILLLMMAVGGWLLDRVGQSAPIQQVHPHVNGLWILPFVALLVCIAAMPFFAKYFWEKYYAAVAVGLGLIVAGYYIFFLNAGAAMASHFSEYISFIFLMGSLFTVSGGILIRIRRAPTPMSNTCILLIGAILSNVFGTTGAAMLLIRPFLRVNKGHIKPYHIVFFIFAVANVGGSLTPIGDPPLFMGFLKGVPFWWVLEHCWPAWGVALGLILAVFFVIDSMEYRKRPRTLHDEHDLGPAVSLFGAINMLFIGIVLIAVFLPGPWCEILLVTGAFGSLVATPWRIHEENHFNFTPIKEVALLFLGIFATMVPALDYLYNNANDARLQQFLDTPGQYYYSSGALSSVLDSAPTYLVFLESELAKVDPALVSKAREMAANPNKIAPFPDDPRAVSPVDQKVLVDAVEVLRKYHPDAAKNGTLKNDAVAVALLMGSPHLSLYLLGISLGAVFFGACTYIGNGPNFMVKSIAEHAGIKCPSFGGYILCYALPVLLPIFILVWYMFLK